LNVVVNVGMGATDPQAKMQRYAFWLHTYVALVSGKSGPPPGIDLKEVWKEGMALTGYQDGSRFLIDGADPALAKAQQQIKQLTMQLQKLMLDKNNKHEANVTKLKTTHETNLTKLAVADHDHRSKARLALFAHVAGKEVAEGERENQVEDRDAGFEHEGEMAEKQAQEKTDAA
jgi:hypothetical protein